MSRRGMRARSMRGTSDELVVVHPDDVAGLPHARDGVGELLVDRAVHLPLLRLRWGCD